MTVISQMACMGVGEWAGERGMGGAAGVGGKPKAG